jgi:amino acid permease
MPEKTKKLINSLKKSPTKKVIKLFSLAPIAIVGWLGFASVGSIQLANIIYDKPDSSSLIIAEKETSNVRTLSDEYGSNKSEQDESISLIKNRYKSFTVGETFIIKNSNKISNTSSKGMSLFFKVKDLSSGNNKICVDFEIKSYNSESETIFEQFCFSSQK